MSHMEWRGTKEYSLTIREVWKLQLTVLLCWTTCLSWPGVSDGCLTTAHFQPSACLFPTQTRRRNHNKTQLYLNFLWLVPPTNTEQNWSQGLAYCITMERLKNKLLPSNSIWAMYSSSRVRHAKSLDCWYHIWNELSKYKKNTHKLLRRLSSLFLLSVPAWDWKK